MEVGSEDARTGVGGSASGWDGIVAVDGEGVARACGGRGTLSGLAGPLSAQAVIAQTLYDAAPERALQIAADVGRWCSGWASALVVPWWYPLVPWWCLVVLGGAKWCLAVVRSRWCTVLVLVVLGGAPRCPVMLGIGRWFSVVFGGTL